MIQPQMPIGVEHIEENRGIIYIIDMIQPQMPIGVEHKQQEILSELKMKMIQPQMPIGVEHGQGLEETDFQRAAHDTTLDANRR